jgi:4-hydroxy-2-oxoglutarate aldolase
MTDPSKLLRGVLAPVTTPFDPKTGDVDIIAFRANLRRWSGAGVDGFVLFGSTGEGLLLEDGERAPLLAAARDVLPPGTPLLAGAGAESTRGTIRLCRLAAEAGADAVLVHPPAYYRPQMTAEALREHFLAVAEGSPLPVVLYHVPPRFSGVPLEPGLVAELVRHPNVVGIKDSTGDLANLARLADLCGDRGAVLVGSGSILYGALEAGAAGGILGVALLDPAGCAEIVRRFREGDHAGAGGAQERVDRLNRAVVGRLGVPGIKRALDMLGMAGGAPRPPLRPLPEREGRAVAAALEDAGLLSADTPR